MIVIAIIIFVKNAMMRLTAAAVIASVLQRG